jgi:flagellar protein FliO/FliZ
VYNIIQGISFYLGGEKLHQSHTIFYAVLVVSIGLIVGNPHKLSAQTPDPGGDGSAPVGETAARPGDTAAGEDFVFQWDTEPDETLPAPTPTILVVLRMVLVLALAAAAIYGVVFFFKRLSRPGEQKNPYLKVLAGVPLGTGNSVSVVSLGNKAWLVGAGTNGVSLIAEITDREMVDAMLLEDSRKGPSGGSKLPDFSAILRRLGGGGMADKRFSADDLRKRRERLQNL